MRAEIPDILKRKWMPSLVGLTLAPLVLVGGITSGWGSARMNAMDHGPFVSWTIQGPESLTYKGIAIRVGKDDGAAVCFDSDLMRISLAWTGDFLQWYPQRDGLEKHPSIAGKVQWRTAQGPGWSLSHDFEDPRKTAYGPLPDDWAHYNGLYLHDDKVILSYSVGDCGVLEMPGFRRVEGHPFFQRTFNLSSRSERLFLRVFQTKGDDLRIRKMSGDGETGLLRVDQGSEARVVAYAGLPGDATWSLRDNHLLLEFPPMQQASQFRLEIGSLLSSDTMGSMQQAWEEVLKRGKPVPDLERYCQPGNRRWEQSVETEAVSGKARNGFVVDRLTVPAENPWGSWIRCTGLDFLSDGRAVVASVSGDVWLVSGIKEELDRLTWRRFATGLYQPLGVKIVDDDIFVLGRDQVTRLHDRNGDGEADFYENFNNDDKVAENFHEFTMNLETDSKGRFYYTKGAPWPPDVKNPDAGRMFQLSPDGEQLRSYATGLRGPNGLAIGPEGTILYSDNEGNWVPTSSVQVAREGGFHGMIPTAHTEKRPEAYAKPLCWIPHSVDNSAGDLVWVPSDQWGTLGGKVLLTSYGKATLSLLLKERVNGAWQGGILNLPLRFRSGLVRARFGPQDEHLYLCGLKVWQSTGIKYGTFARVRYVGGKVHLPVGLHVQPAGIRLEFSCQLAEDSAVDSENYAIEQWNYRWIRDYGSPHYSVEDPDRKGHDPVTISDVRLLDDGRAVLLKIPDIQPVMQMHLQYRIRADDGAQLRHDIYNTIHEVP